MVGAFHVAIGTTTPHDGDDAAKEGSMAGTSAPLRPAEAVEREPGYDDDFFLWSQRQAALIRTGRFELVDLENVAEEIDGLGRSDLAQLGNRLEVLIMHLLKWQFQPDPRPGSWRGTIRTQRGRILRLLRQSPSMRQRVAEQAEDGYPRAAANAADETSLERARFLCPYTVEQLLDDDFWPGPPWKP
jgi:hypothetical protein